ncbi:hypothetical protein LS684_03155 [Cytobacillus spongiae]|uniref:hypothetical protein n=1 Tax=Cytobacillus spongiae TaxID=2901381 RepID=UPI001F20A215|nr:hypothetical protein [Cytobacillus spongiae]UII56498.1 hypothetical protein LS684_03155 [Cytobacillus spongiae]
MKLIITFVVVGVVSILLLLTLPRIKPWFAKIEIILLFMFTSYFCQSMFYTISSAYERLSVVTEHLPFWTVRLQYGLVFPVVLIWLLAIYRSGASLTLKLLATFGWMLFGVCVEKGFLIIGVLKSDSKSWYPSVDLFLEMIVILLSLSFSQLLAQLLKREGIL